MEKTHLKVLKEINPNLQLVSRFKGGMSNHTYLVEDTETSEQFVFRYPGSGASNFVNYNNEYQALQEAYAHGLTSETIYFDVDSGVKLARFVPGSNFIESGINYEKAASYMQKFHNTKFENLVPYDHFGRLTSYENLHTNEQEKYVELKKYFTEIYDQFLVKHIDKPCHNDSQLANFIVTDNDQLFLVDFEYAALNDPIYDFACFGNVELDHALELLDVSEFNATPDSVLRLYSWRLFQCLQWFNVASYKHEIGLGEALNLDFEAISFKYITLANTLRTLINTYFEENKK